MLRLIETPTRFPVPPEQELVIEEYVGRINTGTQTVSIARLKSGAGWSEPAQRPEFDEYTLVLAGELHIENRDDGGVIVVKADQAVIVPRGVKIRYSTPSPDGADYIAVCLPAFAMETANRDEEQRTE